MPADGGRIYAKLAADVSRQLVLALQTEGQESNLTKADVARLLGRNKATVTRALSGGNLEFAPLPRFWQPSVMKWRLRRTASKRHVTFKKIT